MTNILRFEIRTDAPYTDEEQIDLLDNFLAFMNEADADIVDGSEKLNVVDEEDDASSEISDSKKKEIITEFLNESEVFASIEIKNEVTSVSFELTNK